MKGCRPFKPEEIKAIRKKFKGKYKLRDRAWFVLGCSTAFRASELLSIKVADVFQFGCIVSHVTVQRKNMKNGKSKKKSTESRTVALNESCRVHLRRWVKQLESWSMADPDRPLFPSRNGHGLKSLSYLQMWSILKGVTKELKMIGKVATHSMRKYVADWGYEKLKDIYKVMRLLGHKSPASTTCYLSFRQEEIDGILTTIPV